MENSATAPVVSPLAAPVGMKVQVDAYPEDETEGFNRTLSKMAEYVLTCGRDPMFQEFANRILDMSFPRSQQTSNRQVAQALLDFCHENVRFRPDPVNTELVKSPMITLCVPGGIACIPIEDCDGHTCAYLALCRAVGLDVKFLKQKLRDFSLPEGQQIIHHVLGLVQMDSGEWLPVDPSIKGSKIGHKQRAIEEFEVDPLDPKINGGHGAQFVSIGSPARQPSRVIVTKVSQPQPRFASGRPMTGALRKEGREMTGSLATLGKEFPRASQVPAVVLAPGTSNMTLVPGAVFALPPGAAWSSNAPSAVGVDINDVGFDTFNPNSHTYVYEGGNGYVIFYWTDGTGADQTTTCVIAQAASTSKGGRQSWSGGSGVGPGGRVIGPPGTVNGPAAIVRSPSGRPMIGARPRPAPLGAYSYANPPSRVAVGGWTALGSVGGGLLGMLVGGLVKKKAIGAAVGAVVVGASTAAYVTPSS